MNELISKEKHNKKMFSKSLQIKEQASKSGDPATYIHQMYEFFLKDLEECANYLYDKVISQKKLQASKPIPEELRKTISDELTGLVPTYEGFFRISSPFWQ